MNKTYMLMSLADHFTVDPYILAEDEDLLEMMDNLDLPPEKVFNRLVEYVNNNY